MDTEQQPNARRSEKPKSEKKEARTASAEQVRMWKCVRRQEMCGLRCATRLLMVMLCLQAALRVTEAATTPNKTKGQGTKYVKGLRNSRQVRETVLLLTDPGQDVKVDLRKGLFIRWKHPNTESRFKLQDNSTSLVVPKSGLYLVNLKIYYNIRAEHKCNRNLFLKTDVQQYHPSYPEWIDVVTGLDTMQCVMYWSQSVTLSQVVSFVNGTKLRVRIDPGNYEYLNQNKLTYFSVTLL